MELQEINGKVVEVGTPPTATFYEHPKKVGIGKYKSVDYVSVRAPGFKDYMSRPATEQDKVDFPDAWANYQGGMEQVTGSTPLTMLPAYKTAFMLELKVRGITCIEQLADAPAPHEDYLTPIWNQAKLYMTLAEGDTSEQQKG
jgi:hypothetical protein